MEYSEDEFEEENVVERDNDDYDDEDEGEEWEDVNSNDDVAAM